MIIRHNLHICVCSYFPHLVHQISIRVLIPTSGIRAGLWESIDFWSIGSWFGDFLHILKIIGVLAVWNQYFVQATVHGDLYCSSGIFFNLNLFSVRWGSNHLLNPKSINSFVFSFWIQSYLILLWPKMFSPSLFIKRVFDDNHDPVLFDPNITSMSLFPFAFLFYA